MIFATALRSLWSGVSSMGMICIGPLGDEHEAGRLEGLAGRGGGGRPRSVHAIRCFNAQVWGGRRGHATEVEILLGDWNSGARLPVGVAMVWREISSKPVSGAWGGEPDNSIGWMFEAMRCVCVGG